MKITDIQEKTVSIASEISNAFIDFSKMTVSVVAVSTDKVVDGRRVVGYGFNSNGRYSQSCLLRERFIPRIWAADPVDILDDNADNLDPFKIWRVMMQNEKPGGHGERSVAVGVIDMTVWDVVAKIENKPLYKLLAERFNGSEHLDKVFVYAEVFAPIGGFADNTPVEDGYIAMPEVPGIGFEAKRDLIDLYKRVFA